jgi:hypothetical protein
MYNGVAGLVVFFACRVATIPPFWYMIYHVRNSPFWTPIPIYYRFICVGGSIPLDSLNVYWFYRIILIGVKMMKPPKNHAVAAKSKVSTD